MYMGSNITVRAAFSKEETTCWSALVQREWRAFRDILGTDFDKPINRKSCGPIVVLVFPDQKSYHSYMEAYVGFAADAGGLYVKKFHTLFTYQRTSETSFISVEELILHEFGHYLQGCYTLPGVFGTASYDKEPKGFVDEGLAEFWATLNFNEKGCYSMPLRENYMKRICRNDFYPKWKLRKLIRERKGYDEDGVFHYEEAYSFNYFLATQHIHSLRQVLKNLRNNTYDDDHWKAMTGKTIDEWGSLWQKSLVDYCSKQNTQVYPWTCPAKGDAFNKCRILGHGYSTKLWHTDGTRVILPNHRSKSKGKRSWALHMGVDRSRLGEEGERKGSDDELGESDDMVDGDTEEIDRMVAGGVDRSKLRGTAGPGGHPEEYADLSQDDIEDDLESEGVEAELGPQPF